MKRKIQLKTEFRPPNLSSSNIIATQESTTANPNQKSRRVNRESYETHGIRQTAPKASVLVKVGIPNLIPSKEWI